MNRILESLPEAERAPLLTRLEPYRHAVRDPVYRQGQRIESVVFPLSGVFSMVVDSNGDAPVEIATVGREGFLGLPVFLQATLTGPIGRSRRSRATRCGWTRPTSSTSPTRRRACAPRSSATRSR